MKEYCSKWEKFDQNNLSKDSDYTSDIESTEIHLAYFFFKKFLCIRNSYYLGRHTRENVEKNTMNLIKRGMQLTRTVFNLINGGM